MYEWELDFNAMLWALKRLQEFTNIHDSKEEQPNGYRSLGIGFNELLKRVSEHSCPNFMKEEYKTVENCPLKDKCI